MICVIFSEAKLDREFESTIRKIENTALLRGSKDDGDTPTLSFREVNYALRMLQAELKKGEVP